MVATPTQDRTINRHVESKLAGRGLRAPCKIAVATSKGEVTLSGTVQFAAQKATAVQTANLISGVRRVIDRLTVKAVVKF